MKRLQQYFCVFLCCLLLSIEFSSIVYADEIVFNRTQCDINTVITVQKANTGTFTQLYNNSLTIYPNDTEKQSASYKTNNTNVKYTTVKYEVSYLFFNRDGSRLLKAEKPATVYLNNIYYNVGSETVSGTTATYYYPSNIQFLLHYSDDTFEYIETETNITDRTTSFSFEITPKSDVMKIELITATNSKQVSSGYYNFWAYQGEYLGDGGFTLSAEVENEEVGLLSGLLGWVKNIFDKIGDTFNAILELPYKIWSELSIGIQSLFVPTEEYLNNYKADLNILLENKLGAVYQVVNLVLDGWDNIQSNDVSNTIDFPEVTIPLPDNNEFTFGGQEVKIVPDGFSVLVDALKIIVGICCTVLFVNGLIKRYDEVMGVEK